MIGLVVVVSSALLFRNLSRPVGPDGAEAPNGKTVFLFDAEDELVDATPDARELLGGASYSGVPWDEFRHILSQRFNDLPPDLHTLPFAATSNDVTQTELIATRDGDLTRLELLAPPLGPGAQHHLLSQSEELERLATAFDVAPNPIWATDEDGHVTWCNAAYESLQESVADTPAEEEVFDLDLLAGSTSNNVRTRVDTGDGSTRWFEVASRKAMEGWMHFATDIDTLIEAELAQRNFVQTLTKTFAHLPIGLAVFDRDRRLVLFNPALVDLTRLPADFLSARPNLLSFFDHMRETRMMPEPKSYASWREQLTEVINAARDDRYCETWSLASGLTYKITGRPHPDGAVAFLLEDISAEISLTRRFRSELELTQSVIDSIHDAVAVFSRLGVLTFSNTAYRELWDCDPDGTFSEISIVEATEDWQAACEPSTVWDEIRAYVLTMQDRDPWDITLTLENGKSLQCWVEPVSAGATMVRFAADRGLRDLLGATEAKSAAG